MRELDSPGLTLSIRFSYGFVMSVEVMCCRTPKDQILRSAGRFAAAASVAMAAHSSADRGGRDGGGAAVRQVDVQDRGGALQSACVGQLEGIGRCADYSGA